MSETLMPAQSYLLKLLQPWDAKMEPYFWFVVSIELKKVLLSSRLEREAFQRHLMHLLLTEIVVQVN